MGRPTKFTTPPPPPAPDPAAVARWHETYVNTLMTLIARGAGSGVTGDRELGVARAQAARTADEERADIETRFGPK